MTNVGRGGLHTSQTLEMCVTCLLFVFLIDFLRHLICSVLHFLTPAIYVSGRKV